MAKSHMEPYNHVEETSTIVVRMTNTEGHMFASVGLPWIINYHSETIEEDIALQSDIIIRLAFVMLESRFNNPRNYLGNEWNNPKNKYEIIIRKAAWGTQANSEYNNVEGGIQ